MLTRRRTAVAERRFLSAIAYGLMASQALFAALGVDLFTHLAARASHGLMQRRTHNPVHPAGCRRLDPLRPAAHQQLEEHLTYSSAGQVPFDIARPKGLEPLTF
jgi:hypothetical protein